MTAGTGRKPSPKGTRRREDILVAAAEQFAARGYEQTSIQEIAESVGILKGSLYYYFSSKEELLFHVLLRNHEGLYEFVVEQVAYPELEPLSAIESFVSRHVDYVLRHAEISGLYAQELGVVRSVDEWWKALAATRRRHEVFLVRLIERAQQCGDAVDDDAVLSARALLSMANATPRWHASARRSRSAVAQHHGRLAVRALRTYPGDPSASAS